MKYLLPLTLLSIAGCDTAAEHEPLNVSVIGSTLAMQDPDSGRNDAANKLMLAATAQGLLAFDASGLVAPGLAERWIVTDDGLSIIFRLREAEWATGGKVSSEDVARSVRMHMAANRRNPMRAHFSNVAAVVAMTDRVVEIRLKQPDPTFLPILAQPEMAIFKRSGTGPYRVHSRRNGVVRLRPIMSAEMLDEEQQPKVDLSKDVRLRAEGATQAILRFKSGDAKLVDGGSFADLPYVQPAEINQNSLKIEYPLGLFGLRATNADSPVADRGVRIALSVAIDRDALVKSFAANGWRGAISNLPSSLGSAALPAALELGQRPLEDRRASAKAAIQSLSPEGAMRIRVALPQSPGGRLILARLKADWFHIGVEAVHVAPGQPADLVLVDRVASFAHALWYLESISCAPGLLCIDDVSTKVAALRTMADPAERGTAIGAVDAEMVASQLFIPLATPLRWSLVAPQLSQWKPNRYAVHPMKHLRD